MLQHQSVSLRGQMEQKKRTKDSKNGGGTEEQKNVPMEQGNGQNRIWDPHQPVSSNFYSGRKPFIAEMFIQNHGL